MEELIKKISSYNVFNYLLPGTLFAVIGEALTSYSIAQEEIIISLFLYYFLGLIISRFGSLVIEPLLKAIKFINFKPYSEFATASKNDKKLEALSETNNMYRTMVSLFVFIFGFLAVEKLSERFNWNNEHLMYVVFALLLLLFLLAYRKQTNYIVERIKDQSGTS